MSDAVNLQRGRVNLAQQVDRHRVPAAVNRQLLRQPGTAQRGLEDLLQAARLYDISAAVRRFTLTVKSPSPDSDNGFARDSIDVSL